MQLYPKRGDRSVGQLGLLLFAFLLFSQGPVWGQTEIGWDDLGAGIILNFAPQQGIIPKFEPAKFTPSMKALEGKKVSITGYFLVLDARRSRFLLSKNPLASCFFCGNGGPETVLDLKFRKSYNFKVDDVITVEGTLHLNEADPASSYFIIDDAIAFGL